MTYRQTQPRQELSKTTKSPFDWRDMNQQDRAMQYYEILREELGASITPGHFALDAMMDLLWELFNERGVENHQSDGDAVGSRRREDAVRMLASVH